jgi:hypothetical protein
MSADEVQEMEAGQEEGAPTMNGYADKRRRLIIAVQTARTPAANAPTPPNDAPGAPTQVDPVYTPEQRAEFLEEFHVYKVSPPKDSNGQIVGCLTDIKARILADGFEPQFNDHGKPCDVRRILLFLYARKFLVNDASRRKSEVQRLLNPGDAALRNRILRVIRIEGDVRTSTGDAHTPEWKRIATHYGLKPEEHGYNIFTSQAVQMMQRVQHGRSCFLHAPVLTQAYKVQISNPDGPLQMVDICKFVRQSYSCEQLLNYLKDQGGDSRGALSAILCIYSCTMNLAGTTAITDAFNTTSSENGPSSCKLKELLALHGPALVSQFRLEERFCCEPNDNDQPELRFFDGQIAEDMEESRHAMVLVGMRYIEDRWRLLLQNWWSRMQFVEVSSEYFINSEAQLTFVTNDQSTIPERFDRCNALYAEANVEGADIPEVVIEG